MSQHERRQDAHERPSKGARRGADVGTRADRASAHGSAAGTGHAGRGAARGNAAGAGRPGGCPDCPGTGRRGTLGTGSTGPGPGPDTGPGTGTDRPD
ncbi:hypothetical protein OIE63_07260 [Streptomyces sp. NBC_01795]|uniref:hypothetical protein n=1 Tax=Streptomyces sp. NBC_01795 TaxID=2975943 RepID=UPI002DDA8474|nr:hypothetical protein [Streptomyces sp. NBC_01795]WSA91377.1 hypothetical protein OIE63_07260 [Streptomyces sp. NBC_01795]